MFEVIMHVEVFSNKAGHHNHRNQTERLGSYLTYNEALKACYADADNWTGYPEEVEWSMRRNELVGKNPHLPQHEVHYEIIKI